MKILFAHCNHSFGVDKWYEDIVLSASAELDIYKFCITIDPPGPRLSWMDLNKRWQQKDKKLMDMYARLRDAASGCDVFFLYNGDNIHPEFLQYLSTFNVYCCFDDPESSENLSKPVAAAFDAVFYGNIASRFQYEQWGCKKLAWLPIFTAPTDVPSREAGEKFLSSSRDVEISFVGEKNAYRNKRLEMLVDSFPKAKCYGKGWPNGRIETLELHELYCKTQIGWNIHNSTGPINRRLFSLPASGVLQLCDNKTGLGKIFALGEEVIGFDTIPEAIELTRYYLEKKDEQRRIAANGFHRYWQDYHPSAIWQRIFKQISEWSVNFEPSGTTSELPQKNVVDIIKPYYSKILSIAFSVKTHALKIIQEHSERGIDSVTEKDERVYLEIPSPPYLENPEMGCVNMAKERISDGKPFEWPNMVALNWAVTSIIREAKKIIEIGSGTGPFAEHASIDRNREIHCFEEDDFAISWAQTNRNYSNVIYQKKIPEHFSEKFDLLVSLDVFEHVSDMRSFLSFCAGLAPRAIFSTPNREVLRGLDDMGPPIYPPHVREFSAGEFYWLLKQYYKVVFLYHMPDVYVPWLEPMTILTKGTPIIAECSKPIV